MFELTKDFLENLKKAISFEPQLAQEGPNIQFYNCGTCQGTCRGACSGCSSGCKHCCKSNTRSSR